MKYAACVLVGTLAGAAGIVPCVAQSTNSPALPTARAVWQGTNFVMVTNGARLFDANRWSGRGLTNRFAFRGGPGLAPGVYDASPYKGLVLVPGPHPDDCCIINPGPTPRMPTYRPEVRLTPRKPAPAQ